MPNEHDSRRRTGHAATIAIGALALVFSLSAPSIGLPGLGSVDSGDVKNNTLRSIDLKDGKAVRSEDVVDESLTGADIDESSLDLSSAGCKTGLVRARARITDTATIPDTFQTGHLDSVFNCAGGTVEVRRVEIGHYEIRFNGLATAATTTLISVQTGGRIPGAVTQGGDGSVSVAVRAAGTGDLTDGTVLVVVF